MFHRYPRVSLHLFAWPQVEPNLTFSTSDQFGLPVCHYRGNPYEIHFGNISFVWFHNFCLFFFIVLLNYA